MMCSRGIYSSMGYEAGKECCLDCHTKQLCAISCMYAVILLSLLPLLSHLSSSPVLLNVGVGSAVLEVGVGVIVVLTAVFTAPL